MINVEAKIGEYRCPNCRRRSRWKTEEHPNCWRCLVKLVPWWDDAFKFECWGIAATDPEWSMTFNRSLDELVPVGPHPRAVTEPGPRFKCAKCGVEDWTSDHNPLCPECDEFMWWAPDLENRQG